MQLILSLSDFISLYNRAVGEKEKHSQIFGPTCPLSWNKGFHVSPRHLMWNGKWHLPFPIATSYLLCQCHVLLHSPMTEKRHCHWHQFLEKSGWSGRDLAQNHMRYCILRKTGANSSGVSLLLVEAVGLLPPEAMASPCLMAGLVQKVRRKVWIHSWNRMQIKSLPICPTDCSIEANT